MADPRSLERLLHTNSIGQLDLRDRGVDADWLARLLRALCANRSVASLDLWGALRELPPKQAERVALQLHGALASNGSLCVLDLGRNALGDAALAQLVDACGADNAAPLQRLVLSHNELTERSGASLAALISGARCLQHLELKSNQLGNAAAAAMAKALANSRGLSALSLAHNSIGTKGAAALLAALETNTTMLSVELKNNLLGQPGDPGGRVQAQVEACCRLNGQRGTVANPSLATASVANPPLGPVSGGGRGGGGYDESSSDSERASAAPVGRTYGGGNRQQHRPAHRGLWPGSESVMSRSQPDLRAQQRRPGGSDRHHAGVAATSQTQQLPVGRDWDGAGNERSPAMMQQQPPTDDFWSHNMEAWVEEQSSGNLAADVTVDENSPSPRQHWARRMSGQHRAAAAANRDTQRAPSPSIEDAEQVWSEIELARADVHERRQKLSFEREQAQGRLTAIEAREQRLAEMKAAVEHAHEKMVNSEEHDVYRRAELDALQQRLVSEEENVAQAAEQVEAMQNEILLSREELDERAAQLDGTVQESTTKLRDLERDLGQSAHQLALVSAERDRLSSQVETQQRQSVVSADALEATRKTLQEREAEMVHNSGASSSEMIELRRSYDARIESAEQQAIALRLQLTQMTSELAVSATQQATAESEWNRKYGLTDQERSRLAFDLETAQAAAAAAQKTLSSEHETEVSDLREELEGARRELREKESAGLIVAETVDRLRRELTRAGESHSMELRTGQTQMQALQSRLEATDRVNSQLEETLKRAKEHGDRRQAALSSDLESANRAAETSLAGLKAEHDAEVDALQAKLQSSAALASQKHALAGQAASAAREEAESMRAQLAEGSEETASKVASLQSRVTKLSAELQLAQAERVELEDSWKSKYDQSVKWRVSSIKDLQEALTRSEDTVARWERKHRQSEEDVARTSAELEVYESEAATAKRSLSAAHEDALSALSDRLAESEAAAAQHRDAHEEHKQQTAVLHRERQERFEEELAAAHLSAAKNVADSDQVVEERIAMLERKWGLKHQLAQDAALEELHQELEASHAETMERYSAEAMGRTAALQDQLSTELATLEAAKSMANIGEEALRAELKACQEALELAEQANTAATEEHERQRGVALSELDEHNSKIETISASSAAEMLELRRAYDTRIDSTEQQARALQAQVETLSSQLAASAALEQERNRLASELNAAQDSAAAAQTIMSTAHDAELSGLREELEGVHRELSEKETAGVAAIESIAELRRELSEKAEAGSSVTALHAQLRTVSSELESVKYQQSKDSAQEMLTLRAQLKAASSELRETTAKLQEAEDMRLLLSEQEQAKQELVDKLDSATAAEVQLKAAQVDLVAEHDRSVAALHSTAESLAGGHAAALESLKSEAAAREERLQKSSDDTLASLRTLETASGEQAAQHAQVQAQLATTAEDLARAQSHASELSHRTAAERVTIEAELAAEKTKLRKQREAEKQRLQELLQGVKREKALMEAEWTAKHEATVTDLNHNFQTLQITIEKRHADELDEMDEKLLGAEDKLKVERATWNEQHVAHSRELDLLQRELQVGLEAQMLAEQRSVDLAAAVAENESLYNAATAELQQHQKVTSVASKWKSGAQLAAKEAAASARADAEGKAAATSASLSTSIEEASTLRLEVSDMQLKLDGMQVEKDDGEAAWLCKYEVAEASRTQLQTELDESKAATVEQHSSLSVKHEADLSTLRDDLEQSATAATERHSQTTEQMATQISGLWTALADTKKDHERERDSLREELVTSTQAREDAEQRATAATAAESEHKSLFLATKDALNKSLETQQQLTDEQRQWQLGAETALQSQVETLSAELVASASQQSTTETEWIKKHDLVDQERSRLATELEAVEASATAAQTNMLSVHGLELSGLRDELEGVRRVLSEKESAGLVAAESMAELKHELETVKAEETQVAVTSIVQSIVEAVADAGTDQEKQAKQSDAAAEVAELKRQLDQSAALESSRASMQEAELLALREKFESVASNAVSAAVADVSAQLAAERKIKAKLAQQVQLMATALKRAQEERAVSAVSKWKGFANKPRSSAAASAAPAPAAVAAGAGAAKAGGGLGGKLASAMKAPQASAAPGVATPAPAGAAKPVAAQPASVLKSTVAAAPNPQPRQQTQQQQPAKAPKPSPKVNPKPGQRSRDGKPEKQPRRRVSVTGEGLSPGTRQALMDTYHDDEFGTSPRTRGRIQAKIKREETRDANEGARKSDETKGNARRASLNTPVMLPDMAAAAAAVPESAAAVQQAQQQRAAGAAARASTMPPPGGAGVGAGGPPASPSSAVRVSKRAPTASGPVRAFSAAEEAQQPQAQTAAKQQQRRRRGSSGSASSATSNRSGRSQRISFAEDGKKR